MPGSRSQPARPGEADRWGLRREGRDLLVAITGGAIVGMPLLYTMEMWATGMRLPPGQQLALLAGILGVNLLLGIVSGFRHEYGVLSAALESVTAVGLALVFSSLILWLIGEITWSDPLGVVSGKVLFQAVPVSLGVSFADAHVRGKRRDRDDAAGAGEGEDDAEQGASAARADAPASDRGGADAGRRRSPARPSSPPSAELERRQLRQDIRDLSATLSGALLFSINMGPTEEVILIAGRLQAVQLAALVLASLALCYVILYASGVKEQPVFVPSIVQSPLAETSITYAASLVVALTLLLVLGAPESVGSLDSLVASVVTLGLPTAVGGAAGRLVL